MPSNHWKKAARERRDFRQAPQEREVPPHRPKKKGRKHKPVRLLKRLKPGETCWFFDSVEWKTIHRYARMEDAERALKKAQRGLFADRYEFHISDDDNVRYDPIKDYPPEAYPVR